jgi:hypothetical protein
MIKGTPFEHSPIYKKDSAYMNNAIFLHAFKYHFLPNVKHLLLKGRLLLLTDRYLAHIQLGVAQAAADAGVDIITFAPHSTHIAQPLDVGLMSPLNTAYSNAVGRWRLGTDGQGHSCISIRKALEIMATPETGLTPWDRTFTENNVKSAFARAGYPVSGSWVQIYREAIKKYCGEDGQQMIGVLMLNSGKYESISVALLSRTSFKLQASLSFVV